MSDRTEGDTRAIALFLARVSVDPTRVTTDLREARAAIKQALRAARETPGETAQLLWLIPFTPKRTMKRLADEAARRPRSPGDCF